MNKIKTGDVVCLKSESKFSKYQMFTVGNNVSGSLYNIHWFDVGTNELKSHRIHINSLSKIDGFNDE